MAPYSRVAIAVRYKPEDLSSSRGFNSTQQPSDQSARNYDFMALVEVFGWVAQGCVQAGRAVQGWIVPGLGLSC